MDSNQYRNYLSKKYGIKDLKLVSEWFKIDALNELLSILPKGDWYFKGALNLLLNFGYRREGQLTIKNEDLNSFTKRIIESFDSKSSNMYKYTFDKQYKLDISTNGYEGIRIKISVQRKLSRMKSKIHIDLAIEELDSGFEKTKDINIYSVERTLADKYITMIQRGKTNSREKDFKDLLAFKDNILEEVFVDLSRKLLIKREVSKDLQIAWKSIYKENEFVKKYKLETTIEKYNKIILDY